MHKKLNILIVEDELLIAEMLKETLMELHCHVEGIAQNYEQTFLMLKKYPTIDFVFLDINLSSSKTGLNIAQKLNQDHKIPFIFLTSYSDASTIQNAASLEPEGYLVKPFSKSDLIIALELFKSKSKIFEKMVTIKEGHIPINIKHSDILYIKSENIYVEIKTKEKVFVQRNSLQNFLETINNEDFIKIHRSYIVNKQHIKFVSRTHVLVNNIKLPVSRIYYNLLVNQISR